MPFNSFSYIAFLPIAYCAFSIAGDRFRWLVLLLASLLFYAALKAPFLLLVLAVVTLSTYRLGISIATCQQQRARNLIFTAGVAVNVLILVVPKYLPLLLKSGAPSAFANGLVTIGISYFTFQAISYLTDVHLGLQEPERHLGYFALYMSFFPKLLQGPIERAGDLLPQLKTPYRFDYDNVRIGMVTFVWGLLKKVVVADRLALLVNPVYDNVHGHSGPVLLWITYLYALQIYFDFSGYTDMALGTARIFNIRLTSNFDSPYSATSVADFWRRWHISFSRWILDYIFAPLQMLWRQRKELGTVLALLVTFVVSGLWHGASWGFIVWGLLHGTYMSVSVISRRWQKKIHKALGLEKTQLLKVWQRLVTFNLIAFAWIFFRAPTVADGLYVANSILSGVPQLLLHPVASLGSQPIPVAGSVTFAVLTVLTLSSEKFIKEQLCYKPLLVRWAGYCTMLLGVALFSVCNNSRFIYFNF